MSAEAQMSLAPEHLANFPQAVPDSAGFPFEIVGESALFDVVFTDRVLNDYRDWFTGNKSQNACFNASFCAHGILKSPGKIYASLAIDEADLALTEQALVAGVRAITR